MDAKKLDALRRKYSEAKGGDIHDPEFAAVAAQVFPAPSGASGRSPIPRRFSACRSGPMRSRSLAASLDVALIGVPMDLGVTNRAGARLGPRAVRARRAHRPVRARAADRAACSPAAADIGDVPMQSRFSLEQCHADIEASSRRSAPPASIPLAVGGDHSITLLDPQGGRPRPTRRHGAHRRALRHGRRVRRVEVPSRRAVPAGRARRRARSRSARSRSASAAAPSTCGSSRTTAE